MKPSTEIPEKRVHVLHVFNDINFSGAEIMYVNAASEFRQLNCALTALGTGVNKGNFIPQFEKAGIPVVLFPLKKGFKNPFAVIRYMRAVCRFIKEERVDILHIHRSDVFWYFSVCGALTRRPSVMTPHNVFKNRSFTWPKAWMERFTARKVLNTRFQTIGESVYLNELNYYKNPSVRINNWYNAKRFYPGDAAEKQNLRRTLGLGAEDFVIISTGACSPVKNHAAIIQAVAIIGEQFPCVYLHLGHGPLENDEQQQARTLKVDHKIRFLGNRENVRDFLVASDVFVMPSKFEGLSIAAIEAMACQLPSILYRSPGLTDLIKDDDTGFLVSQAPREIAEKIIVLRNNPEAAAEKGRHAFEFVSANFNMENSVREIVKLYHQQLQ